MLLHLIVLFPGFLWIAWDKGKQASHDKIAGTVVVASVANASLCKETLGF